MTTGSMGAIAASFEIERLQACCEGYRKELAEYAFEAGEANDRYDAIYDEVKEHKAKAAEMQLVAGRYQYMHEHAQHALNRIDDLFEYASVDFKPEVLQLTVQNHLAVYTAAVSKVPTTPTKSVDIVFNGPPGPEGPRFVEVEDTETQASISLGTWLQRDDGYWVLRIQMEDK